MVAKAIAASKDWSSNGRLSAAAATHGAAPARPHDRRRFHRGHVPAGGLVGPGAGPDIQHGPRIAERGPDLRGDPRLGAPRHGVSGSDGVIQLGAGHVAASLAVTSRAWLSLPGPGCHFPGMAGVRVGRGLPLCAFFFAAALAAAALAAAARATLASLLAALAASCGVIQSSIGPRAARQTLAWWPPPGMIVSGTFGTRVVSSPRKSIAAVTSDLSVAPAASQKLGSTSAIGSCLMYLCGVFSSSSPGCPANTLTVYGFPPGLLCSGTWLGIGAK